MISEERGSLYNDIKICDNCGAKYEISERKIPIRDSDSIECQCCGKTLMSWNGSIMYTAKLIQKEDK